MLVVELLVLRLTTSIKFYFYSHVEDYLLILALPLIQQLPLVLLLLLTPDNATLLGLYCRYCRLYLYLRGIWDVN